MARDHQVLGKIRGCLGIALREVGSAAIRSDRDCTWSPPCAYHVLWRKAGEVRRGFPMPAPFVVETESKGRDLQISVLLFGRAADYLGEVCDALIRGLRRGLTGYSAGKLEIIDRALNETIGVIGQPVSTYASLCFVTPFLIRNGEERHVTPASFLRGLIDRVDGIAALHGVKLDCDFPALKMAASEIEGAWEGADTVDWQRYSSPQNRRIPMQGVVGRLHLRGRLLEFSEFLAIGAVVHAGSRTSWGQGRYRIEKVI